MSSVVNFPERWDYENPLCRGGHTLIPQPLLEFLYSTRVRSSGVIKTALYLYRVSTMNRVKPSVEAIHRATGLGRKKIYGRYLPQLSDWFEASWVDPGTDGKRRFRVWKPIHCQGRTIPIPNRLLGWIIGSKHEGVNLTARCLKVLLFIARQSNFRHPWTPFDPWKISKETGLRLTDKTIPTLLRLQSIGIIHRVGNEWLINQDYLDSLPTAPVDRRPEKPLPEKTKSLFWYRRTPAALRLFPNLWTDPRQTGDYPPPNGGLPLPKRGTTSSQTGELKELDSGIDLELDYRIESAPPGADRHIHIKNSSNLKDARLKSEHVSYMTANGWEFNGRTWVSTIARSEEQFRARLKAAQLSGIPPKALKGATWANPCPSSPGKPPASKGLPLTASPDSANELPAN